MNASRFPRRSPRSFFVQRSALRAARLIGLAPGARAEPLPDTAKLRLTDDPYACLAPQYAAEALVRSEGFSNVRYVNVGERGGLQLVGAGEADLTMEFAGSIVTHRRFSSALRLHEVGMLNSSPQKILAQRHDLTDSTGASRIRDEELK